MKSLTFIALLALSLAIGIPGASAATINSDVDTDLEPASVDITSSTSGAVDVNSVNIVTWRTENFPVNGKLNISLLKKTSENPDTYELVRTVAEYTQNDGSETWKAERSEIGEELYIQIGCAGTSRYENGCVATESAETLTVTGKSNSNIAAVFGAIGDFFSNVFSTIFGN